MTCRISLSLALALLTACPATAPEDTGTDTGSGTSATGSGSGSGSGEETSSDSSSSADGSSTGDAACASFADETPAESSSTTIEITNGTDAAFLLRDGCGYDFLSITNDAGWLWPGPYCSGTCAEQIDWGCSSCEPCATESFLVLGPGASTTVDWSGELFESSALPPPECTAEELCGSDCLLRRDAAAGSDVVVRVAGATQADCEAVASDPAICACAEGMLCNVVVDAEGDGLEETTEVTATAAPGGTILIGVD